MELSGTQEDYIKALWNLEQAGQISRPKTVAVLLKVKPPTVLSMFQQLGKMRLVVYEKKCGAKLTARGKELAEMLVRKHRLIETFLEKVLHIGEPLLHGEAEKLEHAMSEQLMMHIDRYLGYPTIDPHGEIIPLSGERELFYQLNQLDKGLLFRVIEMPMKGTKKDYCQRNRLLPGSEWSIVDIEPGRDSFLITNGENYISLSADFAKSIKVVIDKK